MNSGRSIPSREVFINFASHKNGFRSWFHTGFSQFCEFETEAVSSKDVVKELADAGGVAAVLGLEVEQQLVSEDSGGGHGGLAEALACKFFWFSKSKLVRKNKQKSRPGKMKSYHRQVVPAPRTRPSTLDGTRRGRPCPCAS